MEPSQLAFAAAVFVLAGLVKGISGMGLPTVAMSVLGLSMTPGAAAALLVLPSLATNLVQCFGPHFRALASRLWPAWSALVVATVFTPAAGPLVSPLWAGAGLGIVLIVYGLWGLWRPRLPDLRSGEHRYGLLAGALTGVVTAMTAVFVIPLVPFLQALRLGRDEMIQALGLTFTVATLALGLRLQRIGQVAAGPLEIVAVLMAAFVGLWLGAHLRKKLSGAAFQRALFVVFIVLGVANLVRAAN